MSHDLLVDKLAGRIDRTRADIKKLVTDIGTSNSTGTSDSTGTSRSIETPGAPQTDAIIPPSPRREDYKLVKHWTQDAYNKIRHPKRGISPDKGEDATTAVYLEDQFGNVLPITTRRQITKDIKAFWQGKYDKGEHLDNITNMGWDIRKEFRDL